MEKRAFEFTLVLKGVEGPSEKLERELFEMGCDDALLYFRDRFGYLDFVREAESLEGAILSAIQAVESLKMEGLKVASVEPGDFVTSAEISRRLNRSKESVRLIILGKRGKGGFPAPVAGVTTKTQIWRWTEVVDWFYIHNKMQREDVVQDAYTIRGFNETLAVRENPEVYRKVEQLVHKLNKS